MKIDWTNWTGLLESVVHLAVYLLAAAAILLDLFVWNP